MLKTDQNVRYEQDDYSNNNFQHRDRLNMTIEMVASNKPKKRVKFVVDKF